MTRDARGSFAAYIRNIFQNKPLTRAQEIILSERIKKGDIKAVHELIKANLRFVINVAKDYQYQGISFADLVSIGNIGLIKAAMRFDGKKNFRFISYAVWWIRQSILQALAEQSRFIRIPLNRVKDICDLNKTADRLETRLKRKVTENDLILEANYNSRDIRYLTSLLESPVSLDIELSEDSSLTMADMIADGSAETLEYGLVRNAITDALKTLDERQRKIIMLYFGLEDGVCYTLDEIGQHLNLTKERIRQLKEKAIEKLQRLQIKYCPY